MKNNFWCKWKKKWQKMSRAWFLVSRALLSKYRKMSRPKKPCHGNFLGFLSRALILMSRPLFLVQNCQGLFSDVTAIFSKNITGTKTNVTREKNTGFYNAKISFSSLILVQTYIPLRYAKTVCERVQLIVFLFLCDIVEQNSDQKIRWTIR